MGGIFFFFSPFFFEYIFYICSSFFSSSIFLFFSPRCSLIRYLFLAFSRVKYAPFLIGNLLWHIPGCRSYSHL